jgi:hypothetical protein
MTDVCAVRDLCATKKQSYYPVIYTTVISQPVDDLCEITDSFVVSESRAGLRLAQRRIGSIKDDLVQSLSDRCPKTKAKNIYYALDKVSLLIDLAHYTIGSYSASS